MLLSPIRWMVRVYWSAVYVDGIAIACGLYLFLGDVVVVFAQGLQASVPEQLIVVLMWDDVICCVCSSHPVLGQAHGT